MTSRTRLLLSLPLCVLLATGVFGSPATRASSKTVATVGGPRVEARGGTRLRQREESAKRAPTRAGDCGASFAQAPGSPFTVGLIPKSVAVGDFNLDGTPDLAAANSISNDVTVLLGNGTGGFAPAPGSPFAVGSGPYSIAVGDFNLDGKPDLATANSNSGNVTVLLGNGAGGFAAAPGSPFAVGVAPLSIVVGDFNLDGNPTLPPRTLRQAT